MLMKIFNYTIGNRTCEFPACSAVHKAAVITLNSKEMNRNIFLKAPSYDASFVFDTAVHKLLEPKCP
jgi:hypothetical protein